MVSQNIVNGQGGGNRFQQRQEIGRFRGAFLDPVQDRIDGSDVGQKFADLGGRRLDVERRSEAFDGVVAVTNFFNIGQRFHHPILQQLPAALAVGMIK